LKNYVCNFLTCNLQKRGLKAKALGLLSLGIEIIDRGTEKLFNELEAYGIGPLRQVEQEGFSKTSLRQ